MSLARTGHPDSSGGSSIGRCRLIIGRRLVDCAPAHAYEARGRSTDDQRATSDAGVDVSPFSQSVSQSVGRSRLDQPPSSTCRRTPSASICREFVVQRAVRQLHNKSKQCGICSITSICCGFVVQLVVQQVHNKSKATTKVHNRSPQQVVEHEQQVLQQVGQLVARQVHNKSAADRSSGVLRHYADTPPPPPSSVSRSVARSRLDPPRCITQTYHHHGQSVSRSVVVPSYRRHAAPRAQRRVLLLLRAQLTEARSTKTTNDDDDDEKTCRSVVN